MIDVWGYIESSVYLHAAEHGEVLPARSVAVARNFVVVLSGTATRILVERNRPTLPAASGDPAHPAVS